MISWHWGKFFPEHPGVPYQFVIFRLPHSHLSPRAAAVGPPVAHVHQTNYKENLFVCLDSVLCVWKIYADFDTDVPGIFFFVGNLRIKARCVLLFRFLLKDFLLLTRSLLSFGSLGKRIRIFLYSLSSRFPFTICFISLFLSFVILFSSIFRFTYTCHVVSRSIFFCFQFSFDLLCRYECSIVPLFLFFLQRLSFFPLQ